MPMNKWLLVEIEKSGDKRCYQTATFFKNQGQSPIGFVGDSFHFDRTILRWRSIQFIVDP